MSHSNRYCTLDVTYSFSMYPVLDSKIQAIVGQGFDETGTDFASRVLTFRFSTLAARRAAIAALAGSALAGVVEWAHGMPGVD